MAPRTRSAAQSRKSSLTGSLSPSSDDAYLNQPPTSFNGKLEEYKFASSTSITVNSTKKSSTKTSTAIIATTSRKRRAPPPQSSSPVKKSRQSSKYAPPSKYAHLSGIPDALAPNLLCLFVGFNPGVKTAQTGHAYSHPSNHFWKLMHTSGCTPRRCLPVEDQDMPGLYSLGLTNIVARPTRDAAELSREEMAAGTPGLEDKVREWRPEVVALVGKSIWEAVWRWREGKKMAKTDFRYGWQDERLNMGRVEGWDGARVFVATSTSGLSAGLKPAEKEAIWRPLGEYVQKRREERASQGTGDYEADGSPIAGAEVTKKTDTSA